MREHRDTLNKRMNDKVNKSQETRNKKTSKPKTTITDDKQT